MRGKTGRFKAVDLYHLGPVGWVESQSIYNALALLDREGLVICYPTSPYICLGLHDDLDYEIDQPYCRERGIHNHPICCHRAHTAGNLLEGKDFMDILARSRDCHPG